MSDTLSTSDVGGAAKRSRHTLGSRRHHAATLAAVVSRAFERTLRDFRSWSGAEKPGERLWCLETLLEGCAAPLLESE